ncbi:MAG: ferritin-like domain-containing protein [Candidatus Binatia bacterium]
MTGQDFIDYLYRKYYPELEGPIIAVRKALAEVDPQSPAFVSLMQRQAKRELRHGIAFTKALLQYPELDHHERAEVAEQAADEYKHHALIKDYLRSRGADVEDIPVDAYDSYFGQFLSGDVEAFRLCNIAEKSAVVFMNHLRTVSKDPEVRRLAAEIIGDEEGHEDRVREKLARIAEDESRREFLERHFVQSWASQKKGVFLEAKELGIDLDKVLAEFRRGEKGDRY